MGKIISTHLGSKAQVTIPKLVRKVLNIHSPEDLLGFVIEPETHTVKLTKLNIVPAEEDFTENEYQKLLQLADEPQGKTFKSAKEAILYHKKESGIK